MWFSPFEWSGGEMEDTASQRRDFHAIVNAMPDHPNGTELIAEHRHFLPLGRTDLRISQEIGELFRPGRADGGTPPYRATACGPAL